ncbi:MAG: transglutaminase-like domain-containing protein [Armatimonadota bacterium]
MSHAQESLGSTLLPDSFTRDWKFDQEYHDIIRAALSNKQDAHTYALHSTSHQELNLTAIFSKWDFEWHGQKFHIMESSTAVKIGRDDVQVLLGSWSFNVKKANGDLYFEWCLDIDESQKPQEALLISSGKGMNVDIFNPEKGKSHKAISVLPAPYGDPYERLDLQKLVIGRKEMYSVFDFDTLEIEKREAIVKAVNLRPSKDQTWVASFTLPSKDGSQGIIYVDDRKNVFKYVINDNIEVVRCDLETALKERSAQPKLISVTSPLDCWVMHGSDLSSLKLRFIAKDSTHNFLPTTGRQQAKPVPGHADQMLVSTYPEREPSPREIKLTAIPRTAEIRQAMRSDTDIESSSPEIITCARKIVGKEKRPYMQARMLSQWVSVNVKATYDVFNGTALETLRSRRGACHEYSILFVALARSLRIPARQVSGWAISGTTSTGHFWAEVFVAGRWIEIDPGTGKLVDATYVRHKPNLWVRLEQVQVLTFQNGKVITEIDKSRPYWTFRSNIYQNRILGISLQIPEGIQFLAQQPDIPIPLPFTEGEVPARSASDPLFILTLPSDAKTDYSKSTDSEPTMLAVSVYEQTSNQKSELDSIAPGGIFFGWQIIGNSSINKSGTKYTVLRLRRKDGVQCISYNSVISPNMQLYVICMNSDVSSDILNPVPSIIEQIVRSAKLSKPDITAIKHASVSKMQN